MSRPATPLVFQGQAGPSSPPETPIASNFTFGKTNRRHAAYGVHDFVRNFDSSSKNIEPAGQGSQFLFNRPEDFSPRSSSPDSSSSSSAPRSVSSDVELSEEETPPQPTKIKMRSLRTSRVITLSQNLLSIEELRSDIEYDSGDALRPDRYSDAESDAAHSHTTQSLRPVSVESKLDVHLMSTFTNLDCNDAPSPTSANAAHDAYMRKKRDMKRRKRLSAGSIKRRISESIGSDTDDEDVMVLDDSPLEPGTSLPRRVRRKTGETMARTSLIFDDPPQRIVEELEPDSEVDAVMQVIQEHTVVPDVDDAIEEVLMHALPYYQEMDEGMDIDTDGSSEESESESESESDSEDESSEEEDD